MHRPRTELHPEHLYKFAGLLFLLALAYRYFDSLSRVLLAAYAAAVLGVAFNAVVRRVPLRRTWTTAIIALVVIVVMAAATWFGGGALLRQARDLVDAFPQIEQELVAQADWIRSHLGLDVRLISQRTREMVTGFFGSLGGEELVGRAGGLLEWMMIPLLIFFGAVFATASPNDHLLVPLLRVVPADRRPAFVRMFELLGQRLAGWVKGQIISMIAIGVMATVAFYLIGVPYALLFGVINGLTEFVPLIGPWAGGIPAVVVAFLDDPMKGVWTAGAILAIQQVEAHLLLPVVMQKVAAVHPFVTLFSIVLFGGIFGFLGVLLALPLVLLIWTVVETLWVERAIDAADDTIPPVVEE